MDVSQGVSIVLCVECTILTWIPDVPLKTGPGDFDGQRVRQCELSVAGRGLRVAACRRDQETPGTGDGERESGRTAADEATSVGRRIKVAADIMEARWPSGSRVSASCDQATGLR